MCSVISDFCGPMDCGPRGSSSMVFSRQDYWSGVPSPTPGDLSDWGIKPTSPALAGRFLTTRTPWKAPRLLQSTGSGLMGFSSWSTQGSVVEARRLYNTSSVVVVLRLRCFAARGISPDQGSNLCVSALKGGFLTTRSPGKPNLCCVKSLNFMCVFFFYGSCWKLTH